MLVSDGEGRIVTVSLAVSGYLVNNIVTVPPATPCIIPVTGSILAMAGLVECQLPVSASWSTVESPEQRVEIPVMGASASARFDIAASNRKTKNSFFIISVLMLKLFFHNDCRGISFVICDSPKIIHPCRNIIQADLHRSVWFIDK